MSYRAPRKHHRPVHRGGRRVIGRFIARRDRVRFLGRRSPTRAGAMMLLLLVATSSRADAPPETPFAEVFAQLAAKLVGGVVNISTTQVTAAPITKASPKTQVHG